MNGNPFGIDLGTPHITEGDVIAFHNWLLLKEPTEIVGRSFEGHLCPVAYWLRDYVPAMRAEVDQFQIILDGVETAVPQWVIAFIDALDRITGVLPAEITAEQALAVLQGIQERTV
jgi:hypothetical protein